MRRPWKPLTALATIVAALALAGGASARPAAAPPAHAPASPFAATAPACARDYYKNVSGHCVHRPASTPAGATARCRDGTYSYSQHASGTCSHHGGVASWIHHP
jgi:Protein of unknown function (DUF3761)